MKSFAIALAASIVGTTASAAPVQWSVADGGNDHYYDIVIAAADWGTARTNATGSTHMGQTGYLASITSAAEQNFLLGLADPLRPDGIRFLWIGGTDEMNEGEWVWVDGPEDGTVFHSAGSTVTYDAFAAGEPSGVSGDGTPENYLRFGYFGDFWNDQTDVAVGHAYIVEYGGLPAVPVPASGLLLLGGLGALALRRKKS